MLGLQNSAALGQPTAASSNALQESTSMACGCCCCSAQLWWCWFGKQGSSVHGTRRQPRQLQQPACRKQLQKQTAWMMYTQRHQGCRRLPTQSGGMLRSTLGQVMQGNERQQLSMPACCPPFWHWAVCIQSQHLLFVVQSECPNVCMAVMHSPAPGLLE